jgi:hypothetical protein
MPYRRSNALAGYLTRRGLSRIFVLSDMLATTWRQNGRIQCVNASATAAPGNV